MIKKYANLFMTILIIIGVSCQKNKNPVDNNPPCPPILTINPPPYNSPVWHPGGKIIGFNYTPLTEIRFPFGDECQGKFEFNYDSTGFWLVDSSGTNMRRILSYQLLTPAWSPDGEWIAFVYSDQIYKMHFTGTGFDTTTITQLTFEGRNYYPDWSPDGNWIAYDSNFDSPNGGYRIWQMDSDGSNKALIVNGRIPEWSNDLSHLLFRGLHSEIYKFNFSNKDTTRVTNLNRQDIYSYYNTYPKYILNDSKILFASKPKDKLNNLYLIENTGNNIKQLTLEGIEIPFSINLDGNRIVYVKYKSSDWSYENGTIWILDIKNDVKTQLTFNAPPN